MNGIFWQGTLLTDGRLSLFTRVVGGLPRSAFEQNRADLQTFVDPESLVMSVQLVSTPVVTGLARAFGWFLRILDDYVESRYPSATVEARR